MIPNEFKILRPQRLVKLTLIVFLIMSLIMAPVLSVTPPACNNRDVKKKSFFNTAAPGFLAVENNTIRAVDEDRPLYTINAKVSAQFYVFDPTAKMFICASKSRRFVPKSIPKPPNMCLFDEVTDTMKTGEIKLMVKNYTLAVKKNGTIVPNKRRRHSKKFQYFITICKDSSTSDLCSLLPQKEKRLRKFKLLANCPL